MSLISPRWRRSARSRGGPDPLDYRMRDAARAAVFDYLEVFHNPRRRQSMLGYMCPLA